MIPEQVVENRCGRLPPKTFDKPKDLARPPTHKIESPKMISLMAIAEVNAQAIVLLASKNYESAIELLSAALRVVMQLSADSMQNDAAAADEMPLNWSTFSLDSDGGDFSTVVAPMATSSLILPFRSALTFRPSTSTEMQASEPSLEMASLTLLYNLALAFQLKGCQDIQAQHRCFDKAAKIYRMMLQRLHRLQYVMDASSRGFYSLCVWNNLACVHEERQEYDIVRNCVENMQCILDETIMPFASPHDEHFFVWNVWLYQSLPWFPFAAAA